MRIFNKIVVVVLILVALPLGTLLLVLPDTTVTVIADALTLTAGRIADLGQPVRLFLALVALVLDLLLFGLLYLELRRRPASGARVTRIQGGEGEITLEAIHQRIHHHLSQLNDVVEVHPDVTARGRQVAVAVDVVTSPYVNVPKKVDEIVQVVREAVTSGMGLKLYRKPSVSIRHVAYSKASPPTSLGTTTPPGGLSSPLGKGETDVDTGPGEKKRRALNLPGRSES